MKIGPPSDVPLAQNNLGYMAVYMERKFVLKKFISYNVFSNDRESSGELKNIYIAVSDMHHKVKKGQNGQLCFSFLLITSEISNQSMQNL
jgi:hypothetical protein